MNMWSKEYNLYNDSVVVEHDENRHWFRLKGEKSNLPSVTSITSVIDKSPQLISWATKLDIGYVRSFLEQSTSPTFSREELGGVLDKAVNHHNVKKEEAATIGSLVHQFAHDFSRARRDGTAVPICPDQVDDGAIKGINAFLDWYLAHDVKIEEMEKVVYSKKHGYVGILDAVAWVDGKRYLLDYKTSKSLYPEMSLQLAAYLGAWEEEHNVLDGSMILHFNKETGDFSMRQFSNKEHKANLKAFVHALELKKHLKQLDKV